MSRAESQVTRLGGGMPERIFDSITDAAKWLESTGKTKNYVTARARIYHTRGANDKVYGFHWRLSDARPRERPVIRYGRFRGERRFPSIIAAARWCAAQPGATSTNLTSIASGITEICRGGRRKLLDGYQWRYEGEDPVRLDPSMGPIIRYGGGKGERVFLDSREAAAWLAENGGTRSEYGLAAGIIQVCKGKGHTSGGYQWRYFGDEPVRLGKDGRPAGAVKAKAPKGRPVLRSGGGLPDVEFGNLNAAGGWCLDEGFGSNIRSCTSNISHACGSGNLAYGFRWRYGVKPEPDPGPKAVPEPKPKRKPGRKDYRPVICRRPDGTVERFESADAAARACIERGLVSGGRRESVVLAIRHACNPKAYGMRWEYESES